MGRGTGCGDRRSGEVQMPVLLRRRLLTYIADGEAEQTKGGCKREGEGARGWGREWMLSDCVDPLPGAGGGGRNMHGGSGQQL